MSLISDHVGFWCKLEVFPLHDRSPGNLRAVHQSWNRRRFVALGHDRLRHARDLVERPVR